MTTRPAPLSVLVLTHDHDLSSHLKRELKEATLTVAKDCESLPRTKRPYDAVLVEARRGASADLADIQQAVDSPHTVIVAAPREVLRQACDFLKGMKSLNGHAHEGSDKLCLESYIESKLSEFVKGMKSSAGRNLHPMLISAVERPLITFALKETNGNQIQAAHLLGMNRNTLRKKYQRTPHSDQTRKTRQGLTSRSVYLREILDSAGGAILAWRLYFLGA